MQWKREMTKERQLPLRINGTNNTAYKTLQQYVVNTCRIAHSSNHLISRKQPKKKKQNTRYYSPPKKYQPIFSLLIQTNHILIPTQHARHNEPIPDAKVDKFMH